MTTPTIGDVLKANAKTLLERAKHTEKKAHERYDQDVKDYTEFRRRASVLLELERELSEGKPLCEESRDALRLILVGDYGWINMDTFQECKGG